MCGRFAQTLDPQALLERLRRDGLLPPPPQSPSNSDPTTTTTVSTSTENQQTLYPLDSVHPSYTVCPGTIQCVLLPSSPKSTPVVSSTFPTQTTTLQALKWGTTTSHGLNKTKLVINNRDDTLLSRNINSASTRCIVPTQGFFEWREKLPYLISPPPPASKETSTNTPTEMAPKMMYLAGICHLSSSTFTIVTTSACKEMEGVHDRMPVVLDVWRGEADEWISGKGWRGVLGKRGGPEWVREAGVKVIRVKGGSAGAKGWVEEVKEGEGGGGIEKWFGKGGKGGNGLKGEKNKSGDSEGEVDDEGDGEERVKVKVKQEEVEEGIKIEGGNRGGEGKRSVDDGSTSSPYDTSPKKKVKLEAKGASSPFKSKGRSIPATSGQKPITSFFGKKP